MQRFVLGCGKTVIGYNRRFNVCKGSFEACHVLILLGCLLKKARWSPKVYTNASTWWNTFLPLFVNQTPNQSSGTVYAFFYSPTSSMDDAVKPICYMLSTPATNDNTSTIMSRSTESNYPKTARDRSKLVHASLEPTLNSRHCSQSQVYVEGYCRWPI